MASTIDIESIKKLSWQSTISYSAPDIITYNLAVGANGKTLSLCFEGHPDFKALPTFGSLAVIAIMGDVTSSMSKFLPNLLIAIWHSAFQLTACRAKENDRRCQLNLDHYQHDVARK